ncbi:bacterio-opsin activator domain-containing protein [Natronoglomus mannanivorans]|uniref:GAF domain-containing protein n=1 Tax=Natronoglomus mannanivorans TaxID=2979990 RepID=A0AAP3E2Q9_9EURY|nr:GAF domain-containing protein [Halobacteria archaeon AArc-xg1-1]
MSSERCDVSTVLVVGTEEPTSLHRSLEPSATGRYHVRHVEGGDRALAILEDEASTIECVVAVSPVSNSSPNVATDGDSSRSGTGNGSDRNGDSDLEFLHTVRDRYPEIPIVCAPDDGDESLAGAAVEADVTAYVPREDRAERFPDRLAAAIDDGRRRQRDRARARQFDAIFEDPQTYTWVLDPDGSVVRANEVASESEAEGTSADADGDSFWDLAWWGHDHETRETVRTAVGRAARGDVAHRELRVEPNGAGPVTTLEVTIRPVTDETGEIVSLVAEAVDVTERAQLEAELRESEELHRVTLNNMTDTVLITDDSGAFTYVCPNVHFIFGYTDDEIHEMGAIDELLGAELFDRAALEESGVLTNIECTATDKAGREHTLLVNVREVSIQDGTVLYSCRDITKRKEREEALTALHRTARRLLYAETKSEIGGIVVEDAPDVLGVEASAALVFDTDENVLQPVACSPAMERLNGPFPAFRASDDSITGNTFVEGETRVFDDVYDSDRLENQATDIRSGAFVPLGDHGVFVAGSAEVGQFDDVSRELADLLAATAEAALDRVERETTLREQERELQTQNRQLSELDRINEIIREIDQALVRAETREEIERAVCERLTAADRFRFAWIGEPDQTGAELASRAWSGHDRGYLDSVSFPLEREASGEGDATEPAIESARTESTTVVPNVVDGLREARWRMEALSRDYQSIVSVPLAYDEFTYGVLTVYADRPSAFDDITRAVFEELGETIASAMGAVERKSALLTASSTRLEFEVRDENFVFQRLAARADCTVSFSGGVQQSADGTSVFATVEGAPVERVAAVARELVSIEDVQIITGEDDGERSGRDDGTTEGSEDRLEEIENESQNASEHDNTSAENGGTLRLRLSSPFLALRLADHGIVLRHVEATAEAAHVVIDVPSSVDSRRSSRVVENAFTDVTLVSKQTVDRTATLDVRSALLERLTDRQLEVLQVAYYGGFFESPRDRTGEEIADTLGISAAAFYRHNRTIQRKLFAALFDDVDLPANVASGGE